MSKTAIGEAKKGSTEILILALVAASGCKSTSGGTTLININSAGETELEELPGVGPVTAAAIIDYRTQNGPFATVDDLIDVTGIGPSTLEQIRPFATV